jgi:thymidylate synthase
MITVKTAMAQDAWKTVIHHIMESGIDVEDEGNFITKELLNVVVTVEDPSNSKPPESYSWSGEKLKKYQKQFLDPENSGLPYTYGSRFREHFGLKVGRDTYRVRTDQVESVIKRLKENPTTRKAVMTSFDPSIDQYQDEIPSMILVDFKLRQNRLHTTAVWRSHDVYGEWIPNFFRLKGISVYVAEALGIKLGPITIHSVSAYIYKNNFKGALKIE